MTTIRAALTAISVFAFSSQAFATPSPTDANAHAMPGVTLAAAPGDAAPEQLASNTESTAVRDSHVTTFPAVAVTVPKPYIWTFQKGNSKVLVLGTVYPEPVGLTFVPASIHRAIAQSGAVIGLPRFDFATNVNLFNVLPIWHAASGAKYLPDGKRLSDVLPPADLQQWNALKAIYLPDDGKIEQMRPMYAGWKLYEAVLRHSGVAVDRSVFNLIKSDADKHGIPMVDAQFHWNIQDPKTAAHAFEPNPQADLACFESILSGIRGVPESSRTLAASWAVGDLATMQSYLSVHTLMHQCWAEVTEVAIADEQGVSRDAEERKAWLAALTTAAAKYPVVFTTADVQNIFKPARQIEWLTQEGYVMVQPDAAQASAPTSTSDINVAQVSEPAGTTREPQPRR
jgi:hypothetical protein